jgi:hypothetical protein
MHYTKKKERLEVVLSGDFNLKAVRVIKELLDDRKALAVDLTNSRFVNSKAIIFLHKLMTGKPAVDVRLKNPPKVFFELLTTLQLHKVWELDNIIQP